MLGPDASLDLRIDDRDSITITRWSGLDLESALRILSAAWARCFVGDPQVPTGLRSAVLRAAFFSRYAQQRWICRPDQCDH